MTKLVDSLKTLSKTPKSEDFNPSKIFKYRDLKYKSNLYTDNLKNVVKEGQRFDPGSKYLGMSGVKGVESRKTINEREEAADKEATRAADQEVADKYAARRVPIDGDTGIADKKRVARRQRGSGRLSTVLSDETLG